MQYIWRGNMAIDENSSPIYSHSDPRFYQLLQDIKKALQELEGHDSDLPACIKDFLPDPEMMASFSMLLLRGMELLDGIQILLGEGACTASEPLIRSLFETYLYIRYLLQDDKKGRALAFQLSHLLSEIHRIDMLDAATESGKQFIQQIRRESKNLPKMELPEFAIQRRNKLNANFAEGGSFTEVHQEWIRQKQLQKRTPKWFLLFDGPRNLRDLAKLLGLGTFYDIYYGMLSEVSHPDGAFRRVLHTGTGIKIIHSRYPDRLQYNSWLAINLSLRLYRLIYQVLIPDKAGDFEVWYEQHVKSIYDRLSGDHDLIDVVNFQ
jgi:hypothetical protein